MADLRNGYLEPYEASFLDRRDQQCFTTNEHKLSEQEYHNGYSMFPSPTDKSHRTYITPALRHTLGPLFTSRNAVSGLEVGPGPRTILASLQDDMRRKISRYTIFEPDERFAALLEKDLAAH